MSIKTKSYPAYVDTSVFGGTEDKEFSEASGKFFDRVRTGKFIVLISEMVTLGLEKAPAKVKDVVRGLAPHVAAATIAKADLIVSWNFKHIVNYGRIKKFNGVNQIEGYGQIDIRSPLEVVYDE